MGPKLPRAVTFPHIRKSSCTSAQAAGEANGIRAQGTTAMVKYRARRNRLVGRANEGQDIVHIYIVSLLHEWMESSVMARRPLRCLKWAAEP